MNKLPAVQCTGYDFRITIDDKHLSHDAIMDCFKGWVSKFVFQYEETNNNKNKHYQGRVRLIKKKRPHNATTLFLNAFGGYLDGKSWYFAPTTNKEYVRGSFIYVMKDESRIAGPWSDKDWFKYVPRHIRNITPYPFQQEVLDSMEVYDDRSIKCIVDTKGNNGKSVLGTLIRHAGGVTIPFCGDVERLIATVCDILIAKDNRTPKLIAVDLPCSVNNNRLSQLMTAVEVIKDGHVYDTRNHYKSWEYDKPQIWVFTNNEMNNLYMSRDRWVFYTIEDKKLVIRN